MLMFGVIYFVWVDDFDLVVKIYEMCSGCGVDVVFEVVGVMEIVRIVIVVMIKGGIVMFVGNFVFNVDLFL